MPSRSHLLAALALGLSLGASGCFLPKTYERSVEPTKEQKLELYTTTATYLYEDDELPRAQEQAIKALELDPKNRPMRRMTGWIRLRMGTHPDLILAERFFRDLVRDGDDNDNTRLGLALACERLGKAYDEVSRAIADGTRPPPDQRSPDEASRDLAKQARDYWDESIAILNRLLESGEGNTNAMNGLQRVHALAGHYDESLAWSQRILERSQEELVAWRRMLQEASLSASEERLFRENERTAINLQTDTHVFAATLLFRLNRNDEALAHLDAVIEVNPDLPQGYSLRGQLRSRVGREEDAIRDIDRFLALSDKPFEHPDIQRAFELRAQCEQRLASR